MKFTQIRNATLVIDYAGKKFLVDPVLAEKGAYPGFEGTPNSHLFNPLVDLPVPVNDLLDVDAVIITHTHSDHWDEAAKNLIPKDMLTFTQNEKDAADLKASGFRNVRVLTENTAFDGITLTKTSGQHGTDEAMETLGDALGEVCGVVFRHPREKTFYIAGDTVWNRHVEGSLETHAPDVVVLNSGDAQVTGLGSIIMGTQDLHEVYRAAPQATVIASHMEAVNHAVLSRQEMREYLAENDMTHRVLVPEDGESFTF